MPLYTPGRRRAIILLLLTSALLLTLDLRGNAALRRRPLGLRPRRSSRSRRPPTSSPARSATPGTASRTTTTWLEENERLREQIDAQRADQIAAQAAIQDYQELLALNDLPFARRLPAGDGHRRRREPEQPRPGHRDQQGLATTTSRSAWPSSVGAGLVGKVTAPVLPNRAYVMLDHATRGTPRPSRSSPRRRRRRRRPRTAPVDVDAAQRRDDRRRRPPPPATDPPTTPPADRDDDDELDHDDDDRRRPTTATPVGSAAAARTSCRRSTSSQDSPVFGRIVDGDIVLTAGGTDRAWRPPDIPVGIVRNVIPRSTAEGPLLEIEPLGRPRRAALRRRRAVQAELRGRRRPIDTQAGG